MDDYDTLKSKGVEVVVCVSVNDAFVMEAWGKSQGATGKIRMLADPSGEFTKVHVHVHFLASLHCLEISSKGACGCVHVVSWK